MDESLNQPSSVKDDCPMGCKLLSLGKKQMTVPKEEAPANYVPAAAVIRRGQAVSYTHLTLPTMAVV